MSDLPTDPIPPTRAVVAIGSAIVDVLVHTDDAVLVEHGLEKGSMMLVDAARSDELYAALAPGIEASGGSAANTAAGIASFGGSVGFIGRVRDDQLGDVFAHDITAIGVDYEGTPAIEGPSTARCLVMVTPDAQRTMCTYLGAAGGLGPDDVDESFVASAEVVYAEGYLWDAPPAKAALEKAYDIAHGAGRRTAFTLSDPFCVGRFREEFVDLVDRRVDLVFANESEICALFEVADFDAALVEVRARPGIWAITRSELGSVVVADGEVLTSPAQPVAELVDTTGAGDLFAAGFLYGFTHGRSLSACAALGNAAAAEVIGHLGARPEIALSGLLDGDA